MAAKSKKTKSERLAKNFHLTFIPERQYLGAMLKYAANSGFYEIHAIADETGIPTGKSSGKAIPTADYAVGMGLARLQQFGDKKDRQYSVVLTNFGRAVYLGDRFLQEELTQWIAHLYLCNKTTGAELWYQLFWNSAKSFGNDFSYDDFLKWVITETGAHDAAKALSPIFRMYEEAASFLTSGAVRLEESRVIRRKAPINDAYAIGYAGWLSDLIERSGRLTENQLTVDDLEDVCGFRSVTGWTLSESQQVLGHMEDKGLISIDRHMQPWIVCFKQSSAQLWTRIYEEFI
jgi:hypothetical protein